MLPGSRIYILFIFWVLAFFSTVALFPGSYSVDSMVQYEQVLKGEYNDWHSPVLPFFWRILWLITGQYLSMYILQMMLYWSVIYLLLFKVFNNIWTAIAGLIFAAFTLFIPQYVMKDTHVVMAWSLAFLLIISLYRQQGDRHRRLKIILAGLLIMYSTSLRITNVSGAVFLFYMLVIVVGNLRLSVIKAVGISVLLCATTILSSGFFVHKILNTTKVYPEYKFMLLDIIGITKHSGIDYIPESCKTPAFDKEKLFNTYTPASIDDIYWPQDGTPPVFHDPYNNESLYKDVRRQWLQAVQGHPFIYLKNRFEGFLYFLRLKERFPKKEYWDITIHISANEHNISRSNWDVVSNLFSFHYYLHEHTVFFAPWLWLLINMLLFIYCIRYSKKEREYRLQAILQLSAISFILSMALVYQHDRDFRYIYWNYWAACIGIIHCIYLTLQRRRTYRDDNNNNRASNPDNGMGG